MSRLRPTVTATALTTGVLMTLGVLAVRSDGGFTLFDSQIDDCLCGFLDRDPSKTNMFIALATPIIKQISRRAAPWLPEDLHDEVINQTFVNLLASPNSSFDPVKTNATKFIRRKLSNALRQVRESYRPPGQPSRGRVYRKAATVEMIEGEATSTEKKGVSVKKQFAFVILTDADDFPEPISSCGSEAIEMACDAATILEMATPMVR